MKNSPYKTIVLLAASALILAGVSTYRNLQSKKQQSFLENQLTNNKTLEKLTKASLDNSTGMIERVDFDSSVLSQERFYTEKEIQTMTEDQFSNLLKEVASRLPKLSDIKKIPIEALHHTPAPVLQAGKELGLIKEVLKIHESYENLALGFYQTCALNKESPTPVRALCLTNLVEIKRKKGETINKKLFSKEIIELSKMVTDL